MDEPPELMNGIVDISDDFWDFTNTYFVADSLTDFNPQTGTGHLQWVSHQYETAMAFNNMRAVLQPEEANIFPGREYAANPVHQFSIEFVSPRTVRIHVKTGKERSTESSYPMLVNKPPYERSAWDLTTTDSAYIYKSSHGKVVVRKNPWHIEFYDKNGRLLTKTNHKTDNARTLHSVLPFSYVRRSSDYSKSMAAVFELSPGEKIFGTGESFTQLNKRGQRIPLWVNDPNGVQTQGMYKPIPFFMSSRGYGMFVNSSTPMTFDFGHKFNGTTNLMIGDDELDLFVFLGEPKDVLDEYTALTGKASMPPLWSFGFWMSRITYFSEKEVRNVAQNLRKYKIPSDVIHLDTGWFETDWRSDFQFSQSRFGDPEKMISDLKEDGFHISLWQLPYFVPKNRLYDEVVEKGYAVTDAEGDIPYADAIFDFSNPEGVEWYQDKIAGLLELGVDAIKVDFGEAGPLNGIYHSGRTGFYEHNLYPLRYNKAIMEVTKEVTGENIIWARSAWAGSQRYPIHWGGDAANSSTGMAATLRGGLSLGLSGFSFWSHDMGGFTLKAPEELYRRWAPFGFLTSHSRSHGGAPTEPWEYGEGFMDQFRRAAEMRYRLMPYIYAQAKESAENGLPMLRALFVEFPDDPGSWNIDDEYLFGSDILVAPLLQKKARQREVYMPPGKWIDYQTGEVYRGGWHRIEAGEIPIIMLVKSGTVIPHIELAQSTSQMDWSQLKLVIFGSEKQQADGSIYLPDGKEIQPVTLYKDANGKFQLQNDPLNGKLNWQIISEKKFRSTIE
ncbi:MAG TPA: TIM-barrel domain-containing protein [Fodinibius sp.]|nr:TIM-barrel domain-containing protein [Fodinibius sp.]